MPYKLLTVWQTSKSAVITGDNTLSVICRFTYSLSIGILQKHAVCILFSDRGRSCLLPNFTCIELCEMVSVLVCILPSLVSVESMSWRQFLPLPHSLLVHYLTHPLARLTLEILFIALSGFSSAGPIRSISAPFEERITNISPLQPQTPHVQWHQWIPLMCQDEYVCKCVFIN